MCYLYFHYDRKNLLSFQASTGNVDCILLIVKSMSQLFLSCNAILFPNSYLYYKSCIYFILILYETYLVLLPKIILKHDKFI